MGGVAALAGSTVLPASMLPVPELSIPTVTDPYAAFAKALVEPILSEIKEASVLRQLMAIKGL